MINFKIINLSLSSFLLTSTVQDSSKPFFEQSVKKLIETPDNSFITNAFVDLKNTLWVSTNNNSIYYKTEKASKFTKLNLSFSQNLNSVNILFNFVKTYYTQDPTFYFYVSAVANPDIKAPVTKVSYEKDTPVITNYDLTQQNIASVNSMWADNRGVIIAGTTADKNQQQLFTSSSSDLTQLAVTAVQPDSSVYDKKRVVTTLFRADHNSNLQDMIVISTSTVNPYAEQVNFDPSHPALLTGTTLDGSVFNKISIMDPNDIFNNVVISQYQDTGKTAYLLTGCSWALSNHKTPNYYYPSYSVTIDYDQTNKSMNYFVTWNTEKENEQTKQLVSIDDYIFVISKHPSFQKYNTDEIRSFTLPKPAGPQIGNATDPISISDENNLKVNQKFFTEKMTDLENKGSNLFYTMPTMGVDTFKNLYIGVENTVMVIGEVNLPPDSADDNVGKTGLILGIIGGVVGFGLIAGGAGWYFFKKKRKNYSKR